jgi:hypothetical protein
MSILNETFSTHQVAVAANVAPGTLQNWLKRGVIVGHRDEDIEGGGIQGNHRKFSFFAVMQIAVAKALIDAGVTDLKKAFDAAVGFAHIGGGPIGNVEPGRIPALPFHFKHGETLLVVSERRKSVILHRPNVDDFHVIRHRLQSPASWVTVDAGEVFRRVCAALGKHPSAVMDAEYAAAPEMEGA